MDVTPLYAVEVKSYPMSRYSCASGSNTIGEAVKSVAFIVFFAWLKLVGGLLVDSRRTFN